MITYFYEVINIKTIYLIRHSTPIKNTNIQQEKIPLSKEGEKLAKLLAEKLFKNNIDEIYSSTYERAISTAKYIAQLNNINININKNFNERKLGTTKNVDKSFWITQLYEDNAKQKNGESQKEVRTRMLNELIKILNNDKKNIVIVSHATAITFLLMNWCKLESATLENKKRHLTFNRKDIINDSFNTPEIFKLKFNKHKLISIKRIIL